ncbi:MAG: DHH family phosphoesterase [bacterium]|nr:DHH family phosphoesterase [bacterium]
MIKVSKLKEIITNHKQIIIMPHKDTDLDAFGAALGLYFFSKTINKKTLIIFEEKEPEHPITKSLENLQKENIAISYITKEEAISLTYNNALLILVDFHLQKLSPIPEIIDQIKDKVIIDHHIISDDIVLAEQTYIDENASSTCEMITLLLQKENIEIPRYVATIILGGISIDTNNFTMKTTYKTYSVASYLTKLGASSTEIKYLLKEDLSEYFTLQEILQNIIIINKNYAICTCDNKIYTKEFLAKIASIAITFENIEVAFGIGKITEEIIGISTRSIGNIPASTLMEKFGGGGHKTDAASQVRDKTIEEVKEQIINLVQ